MTLIECIRRRCERAIRRAALRLSTVVQLSPATAIELRRSALLWQIDDLQRQWDALTPEEKLRVIETMRAAGDASRVSLEDFTAAMETLSAALRAAK